MINRTDLNFLETVGIATIAALAAYASYRIGYLKAVQDVRKETDTKESKS